MANPFKKLKDLLPDSPLLIGTVDAHIGGDQSAITLIGGGQVVARGQTVPVGQKAFVRNGIVEGQAPNLSAVVIEI